MGVTIIFPKFWFLPFSRPTDATSPHSGQTTCTTVIFNAPSIISLSNFCFKHFHNVTQSQFQISVPLNHLNYS